MSKLTKTSDYIENFIEDVIANETMLERLITWRILSNNKQKELIKITKSSAVTEYFAKMTDSVIIYVNEELFDRMSPQHEDAIDYRKIIIEDALATIQCIENDNTGEMKINITKPEIQITKGCYEKYGQKLINAAECVVLALEQIKDEEKAKKEAKKNKKGNVND
jgi:hypothetical protein